MTNKYEAFGKIAAALTTWAIIFVTGMATTYYGAYVLGYHWQWFLVPEGYALPSIRARIGMALIVGLFSLSIITVLASHIARYGTKNIDGGNERSEAAVRIAALAFTITLSWGMGWLWNWWLG